MEILEDIHQAAVTLMEKHLPSFLTYHSIAHTLYVMDKAEFIAEQEKVSHHDKLLIRLGALFHDTGFIRQYKNHEEAGCEIAREVLDRFNFDEMETNQICDIIMATKIPQSPMTLCERIVCDADLEYLGTDLYPLISQSLFTELQYINPELERSTFNRLQVSFISNHVYHTNYCKLHREEKKWQNLKNLMASM
ncbi:MAG: HD domain-containing protein [Bacteroidota bacterium]|nr:HD domain-containing protein [Bacteroidota bacterium]